MSEVVQPFGICSATDAPSRRSRMVLWLQIVTLLWMSVECGIAIYAASAAHSPALLAFGSDSLVELLSASLVLAQLVPGLAIPERSANRAAGSLLFLLALIVAATAMVSLVQGVKPAGSRLGIGITLAALILMPVLAWLKRREAKRTHHAALAADGAQSAMCAYLALVTLAGLAVNAVFHAAWVDPLAALIGVPILVREGRTAWQGNNCGCR